MTLDTHHEHAAAWADTAAFDRLILTQLFDERKTYRRWSKGWRRCNRTIRAHVGMMYRWYGPRSVRALDGDDVRQLERFHQADLFAVVQAEQAVAGAG
jgi:hypothetical protein